MLSRVQSVLYKRGVSVVAAAQVRAFSAAIEKVGVVGLGLMGHGIAQVSAQAGFQVLHLSTTLCHSLPFSTIIFLSPRLPHRHYPRHPPRHPLSRTRGACQVHVCVCAYTLTHMILPSFHFPPSHHLPLHATTCHLRHMQVSVVESNEEALARGMARIEDSLGLVLKRGIKKGTLTQVSHIRHPLCRPVPPSPRWRRVVAYHSIRVLYRAYISSLTPSPSPSLFPLSPPHAHRRRRTRRGTT